MEIQIGLVKIPCTVVNLYNSKCTADGLHNFSTCCNEPVGNKNYCKGCGEIVGPDKIVKGIDKDTILTKEQLAQLKEVGENLTISVLGIKNDAKNALSEIAPFIIKSQIVLPSIKKGFKKSDLTTFFGFKNALQKSGKYCVVKYTFKFKEHLGILTIFKDDLIFLEVPFLHLNNNSEITRLKEQVAIESSNIDKDISTQSAINLISGMPEIEIENVNEQKNDMMKEILAQINLGENEK